MTRLSAAMCRRLGTVPDSHCVTFFDANDLRTLQALEARGLVSGHGKGGCLFKRTPFGRETAERLEKTI